VRDLEQRVDVLQIDLPKFEYLYLFRMRRRQVDWKVLSFLFMGPGLKPVRPYFLKDSIVTVRRMWLAVFNSMAGPFALILGLYRLFDQMPVSVELQVSLAMGRTTLLIAFQISLEERKVN
jgi:hypothetical protein